MPKNSLPALAAAAGLAILLGAGCQQFNYKAPVSEEAPVNAPSAAAPATTPSDFAITVEALNPGIVKAVWTAPANASANAGFRVLHSARPEPTLPGAYWYQRSSNEARDATFGKLPPGKRYFRVCEFINNECARYSNEVEVNVE